MSHAKAFWIPLEEPGQFFLDVGQINQMVFIAAIQLKCQPDLYNQTLRKQPVDVTNELVLAGNSSFKLRSNLYLPEMANSVATEDRFLVMVDAKTMKPAPFPPWWQEKYAQYNQPGEEPRVQLEPFDFRAASQSGHLQEEKVTLRTMDIDPQLHVNNNSYLRFCYDAYVFSHIRQFGSTGNGDPFRNTKQLTCSFKGPAGLNDLLTVILAQDTDKRDTYHFQIANGDKSNVIFESCIDFFPLEHT